VSFPPRVIVAVVVAAVLAVLAAWAFVRLPYVRGLPLDIASAAGPRIYRGGLLCSAVGLVVIVLPAYWD